ncbi:uncharacterized protein LOC115880137 [Sitophilus oryzae]|uniref:Uncharacterized protein LOC115880137 n=1 Tax=Sitophilus oryzae TaxID=7048 RepID=A0A6J2XQK4_SITOR|nr:uncharacterized protein LOC115880137 [Sitophilus oryzae]
MKPPCPERGKLGCSKKFSENQRAKLFADYWGLGIFQRQRDFLGSCVEKLITNYRRITSAEARNPNRAFYLTKDDDVSKVRVRKTFLISTFGITEQTLQTVIHSKVTGSGIIAQDQRGKHGRHLKIDQEILESVIIHIKGIPRVESHYLRAQTSREFVDGGLSIAELRRHYTAGRRLNNREAANYDTYTHLFNTEFNIGFFAPRKDQRDICEAYKNASNKEKEDLETNYEIHQEEKMLSRNEKAKDKEQAEKEGSTIVLAVYDLQAVLPVPTRQTSAFFHKSRLNCYNFTISEITKDNNVCFFWHEGLAQRGAIEIGTCVLKFLEEVANDRPGCDIIFYTDNCGGQQKNRYTIGMYLYALKNYQINSITHKYLIRGHTQNEGDAVHSVIEKSLKKLKKSGLIYVPEQYVFMIRNAKKKGNSYIVKEMNFNDFIDLKRLSQEL